MISQMLLATIRLIKTAADPKSLARPDKGCISRPIRSTTASIAVLIISVKIINTMASISITCSLALISKKNEAGIANNNSKTSCLKADSCLYNQVNAFNEFNVAKYILFMPLGLFLLSNTSIHSPFLMV